MITAIQLLTALAGIATLLVKLWAEGAPKRKANELEHETQLGRVDIVSGNTDNIAVRVDRVREQSGDSPAGIESTEDVQRRIDAL